MDDIFKIAVGVALGLTLYALMDVAIYAVGGTNPPILRGVAAMEKIAAECVVNRGEP